MNFSNYNRKTIHQAWSRDALIELSKIAPHTTLDELKRLYNRSEHAIKKKCWEIGVKYKRE